MQLFRHSVLPRAVRVLFAWQLTGLLAFCQSPGFLKLAAVEGEGAFNDAQRKIGHPPSVRLVDESDNPIKGAQVTFTFPMVGPGATFPDGRTTAISFTDEKGIARCPAYRPNSTEGRFNIQVGALYQAKTARMVISQSNTLAGGTTIGQANKGKGKLWILVLVAGGAAGGILAARSGSHNSAATPAAIPTVLSPGTITVGGPK
jgi:hypothetical protein